MNRQAIVEEIQTRAGLRDTRAAERALWATWSALGSCVAPEQRSRLIAHLPPDLHTRLIENAYTPKQRAVQIYERVATSTHLPLPQATELAQVALRAIVAGLNESARELIVADVPEELAELLSETKTYARPAVERAPARLDESSNLASGRPGSSRPISDASGTEAQHGSEADWSEDRMSHTLSSAREDDE